MQRDAAADKSSGFTRYQKFVVAVLAFLQFTVILDFMVLAPLGAILMPSMHISTVQFGMVVSVYAFSAGGAGLLAAGFADQFDRKKLLLFFYGGFILGTLLCGIATDYRFLLIARMITGLFGGVIGSIVFAITTDLFELKLRGRVMGIVQTAFAASQVLGIPLGLFLANRWGWNSSFLMIVVVSLGGAVVIFFGLKPIDGHLSRKTDRSPLNHLLDTISRPRYLRAFATTALLSTGGFMMMPFSSAFMVSNLKIGIENLPMVYLITGACNIVAGPLIGRLVDSIGKFKTFMAGSTLGIVMVFIYTNLGVTPIVTFIVISVVMFVAIMSRMISSSTLMSAIPDPSHRGSFMSVSSSIQQISGGLASAAAGMIVIQTAQGPLQHFDRLGYVVMVAMALTAVMMYGINRTIESELANPATS
jgi:predicted MFS family arabinose efflux permease